MVTYVGGLSGGCVVLEFRRDLRLPCLAEIRELESEFNDLPFPSPPYLIVPLAVIALVGCGLVFSLVAFAPDMGFGSRALICSAAIVGLAVCWLRMRTIAREQAKAVCHRSRERREHLYAGGKALLTSAGIPDRQAAQHALEPTARE